MKMRALSRVSMLPAHIWRDDMFLTRGAKALKPKGEFVPKKGQAGYLHGIGANVDQVGESDDWHFRAEGGQSIASWQLYYGNRNIGLELYPTHEGKDWPDILFQMLLGLKGLAENPMDEDEVDEIIHHANKMAVEITGFPWFSKKSKNPFPKGTPQYELWGYTFRCAYKREHGEDFKA